MSWDFAIYGKIEFPEKGVDKWLTLSKDPRKSINEVKYGFDHNLTRISDEIGKLI